MRQSLIFWSGAASRMAGATVAQREAVCERLEEYFDGSTEATETDINDFVWFECDDILMRMRMRMRMINK